MTRSARTLFASLALTAALAGGAVVTVDPAHKPPPDKSPSPPPPPRPWGSSKYQRQRMRQAQRARARKALGEVDGDICRRDGCTGTIELRPPENCSCHIVAPCSACESPRMFCPACGWDERYD